MFAVVFVPNFALQSLLRHELELRERPVVLVEAADANLSKVLVLECTRAAESAGVCPGLSAPQAQARCRNLVLKSRSPAAEQSATDILLQAAYAFSSNIENTAPGVCTIDLRGLNFGYKNHDESVAENPEIQKPTPETNQDCFTSTAKHDNAAQRSFEFFENITSEHAGSRNFGCQASSKISAGEIGNASFTLTPALSLGERELRHSTPDTSERQNKAQSGRTILPLPEGEGEEHVPQPSVQDSQDTEANISLSPGVRGNETFGCTANNKCPNPKLLCWASSVIAALQRFGLEAQIGIASTPNIALLAARAARKVLVIERVREFFESLPFAALEPTPQVFDVVRRWGIHTASAFLALGKDAIAERLGAEALELFHRANAQTIRPLNIVVPADTFEEQMEFEAQIETIEPLLFVLRRFVEQLATRISLTYRVVTELRLTLVLESGSPHERTLKVPAPTGNVETLFRMLHTHLENLRTDAPIQSLRLSATPVRAEGQQFGLFESALRDPNHFHETLARLTALLGEERVGTPVAESTHRPDTFRMKTPEFGESHGLKSSFSPGALELECALSPHPGPLPQGEGESLFSDSRNQSGQICQMTGWNVSLSRGERAGVRGKKLAATANARPFTSDAIRSSAGLCLRRFRSPIHADVEMNNGQPVFISTLVMSACIKRVRGPWCTSGTWWDPRRWARQEWDVETEMGEVYRVRNAEGDWVVEGVYD